MRMLSIGVGSYELSLTQDEHKKLSRCVDHGLAYFELLELSHHPELWNDAYAFKMAIEQRRRTGELETRHILSPPQCCAIDMILASLSALYDGIPQFNLSRHEVDLMAKEFDALLNSGVIIERDL